MEYKLGCIEANTKKELLEKAVEHCGLSLPADDMIGKKVIFKDWNPQMGTVRQPQNVYEITGCQKVWGYDEQGKYTMIKGYRAYCKEIDNSLPLALNEVTIL